MSEPVTPPVSEEGTAFAAGVAAATAAQASEDAEAAEQRAEAAEQRAEAAADRVADAETAAFDARAAVADLETRLMGRLDEIAALSAGAGGPNNSGPDTTQAPAPEKAEKATKPAAESPAAPLPARTKYGARRWFGD